MSEHEVRLSKVDFRYWTQTSETGFASRGVHVPRMERAARERASAGPITHESFLALRRGDRVLSPSRMIGKVVRVSTLVNPLIEIDLPGGVRAFGSTDLIGWTLLGAEG